MDLKVYRLSKNLSVQDAAAALGVSEVGYRYWEKGQKRPEEVNMSKIFLWSSGAVTPNDFYPLPDLTLAGVVTDQLDMFSAGQHQAAPVPSPSHSIGCASASHSRIHVNHLSTTAAPFGAARG